MDKRDIALQMTCPTISVPRFSDFIPSSECGDRVLVASNGLFIEISRKWGYFIRKIGDVGVTVPFGIMHEKTILLAPRLRRELFHLFNEIARNNSQVEIGASIVWNEYTNTYRLIESESIFASSGFLSYKMGPMIDGEHLIVDCHSHSTGAAFFSSIDDDDDKHTVKFSYVAGHCHRNDQSTVMRLCLKGKFEHIDTAIFFGSTKY